MNIDSNEHIQIFKIHLLECNTNIELAKKLKAVRNFIKTFRSKVANIVVILLILQLILRSLESISIDTVNTFVKLHLASCILYMYTFIASLLLYVFIRKYTITVYFRDGLIIIDDHRRKSLTSFTKDDIESVKYDYDKLNEVDTLLIRVKVKDNESTIVKLPNHDGMIEQLGLKNIIRMIHDGRRTN